MTGEPVAKRKTSGQKFPTPAMSGHLGCRWVALVWSDVPNTYLPDTNVNIEIEQGLEKLKHACITFKNGASPF